MLRPQVLLQVITSGSSPRGLSENDIPFIKCKPRVDTNIRRFYFAGAKWCDQLCERSITFQLWLLAVERESCEYGNPCSNRDDCLVPPRSYLPTNLDGNPENTKGGLPTSEILLSKPRSEPKSLLSTQSLSRMA